LEDGEFNSVYVGFPSCRLVLVAMGFFAFFNCYTLRVNLSVAIVVMVNSTHLRELERADAGNLTSSESSEVLCDGDVENTTHSNATDMEQVLCLTTATNAFVRTVARQLNEHLPDQKTMYRCR